MAKVMVVEDDLELRGVLLRGLQEEGFETTGVLLFPSFSSALAMLTQPAAFDCGTIMSAFCSEGASYRPLPERAVRTKSAASW